MQRRRERRAAQGLTPPPHPRPAETARAARRSVDPEEWTREEVSLLRRAAREITGERYEKNDRWRRIAAAVGNGRSKRDCFDKYKSIKQARKLKDAAADAPQDRDGGARGAKCATPGKDGDRPSFRGAADGDGQRHRERLHQPARNAEAKAVSSDSMSDRAGRRRRDRDSKPPPPSPASPSVDLLVEDFDASVASLDMEDCEGGGPGRRVAPSSAAGAADAKGSPAASERLAPGAAQALRLLLLGGEGRRLGEAWLEQGFFFRGESRERSARGAEKYPERPGLALGLVQRAGGPCGPLAAVQARMIAIALRDAPRAARRPWEKVGAGRREDLLLDAIAELLWACAAGDGPARPAAALCLEGRCAGAGESIFERLAVSRHGSLCSLRSALGAGAARRQLRRPGGAGVCLVVCSAVLSRGLVGTARDASGCDAGPPPPPLIGQHSYASQELVNLLLFGRAFGQVFDGDRSFGDAPAAPLRRARGDGDCGPELLARLQGRGGAAEGAGRAEEAEMVLRGVPCACEVGFLTLFEAYGHVEVGPSLKEPGAPVWVVCSESHYSVLYMDGPAAEDERRGRRRVDLHYYDELGEQEAPIVLTLDRDPPAPPPTAAEADACREPVPPLDLVVRTRWPGAAVDWNGTDPIL